MRLPHKNHILCSVEGVISLQPVSWALDSHDANRYLFVYLSMIAPISCRAAVTATGSVALRMEAASNSLHEVKESATGRHGEKEESNSVSNVRRNTVCPSP